MFVYRLLTSDLRQFSAPSFQPPDVNIALTNVPSPRVQESGETDRRRISQLSTTRRAHSAIPRQYVGGHGYRDFFYFHCFYTLTDNFQKLV